MGRLPLPLRLLLLIAFGSSTTSAIPASAIFARQKSCPADNFQHCGSDFPDNFCCDEGTKCLALAGRTTVLCCPEDSECNLLGPITCNIDVQNAKEDPKAPLKTTVFDVDLEKCGENTCCPFGYSCVDDNKCRKNKDQSEKPKADKPTSTASTATEEPTEEPSEEPSVNPSTTTTGTEAPGSSATGDESNSDSDSDSDKSGPDTTTIIGGVVGACGLLLILAVIIFVCVRRRANRKPKSPEMIHGRNISEPIPQPDSYRSEFMRRPGYGSGGDLGDANGAGASIAPQSQRRLTRFTLRPNKQRLSIPNRFENVSSPDPSCADTASNASNDERPLRSGHVTGARLAPIRAMKASSRHLKTKSRHLMPERAAFTQGGPPPSTAAAAAAPVQHVGEHQRLCRPPDGAGPRGRRWRARHALHGPDVRGRPGRGPEGKAVCPHGRDA